MNMRNLQLAAANCACCRPSHQKRQGHHLNYHRRLNSAVCFASLVGLFGYSGSTAFAQTAGQITQPTYAPSVVRPVSGGIDLPLGGGPEAPAGAEKLSVKISALQVEGSTNGLTSEIAAIEARLKGKRVTGAMLFAAARDLEAAYARAGHLLVRVTLPPQTVRDGMPLKLLVTDGYVEAIDTSALPEKIRERIGAILNPLIGKASVTKQDLERRLLLAGDTPGVVLKSTLKAGDRPGSTIIVVDGTYSPVTTSIATDNGLSDRLGTFATTFGLDVNNVFGLGEIVYARLSGYPGYNGGNLFSSDPRNRQMVLGVNVPLGLDGWWLNLEGVDSRTHPTSDLAYTMRDDFQRFSVRTGYNWLRSRDLNTTSILLFDIADENQKLALGTLTAPFTSDKLRVLRLTQSTDVFLPWGATVSGNATASFGLDAFGARHGTMRLPLSRAGAEPDFAKLDVSGRYNQSFVQGQLALSVAAKAQTSFGDALPASEQFGLGGFDWLSAFDSGTLQGDAGAAIRTELAFPAVLPAIAITPTIGGSAAPYVFAAAGIAKLERPTAVEKGVSRAASFGAGLRFNVSENGGTGGASLALEYAHGEATSIGSENRFNLRLSAKF